MDFVRKLYLSNAGILISVVLLSIDDDGDGDAIGDGTPEDVPLLPILLALDSPAYELQLLLLPSGAMGEEFEQVVDDGIVSEEEVNHEGESYDEGTTTVAVVDDANVTGDDDEEGFLFPFIVSQGDRVNWLGDCWCG